MKTLPGIALTLAFAQLAALGLLYVLNLRRMRFAPAAGARPRLSRRMQRILSREKELSEIDFG
mgnify:CR=1 FL=1